MNIKSYYGFIKTKMLEQLHFPFWYVLVEKNKGI